jgi:putative NADH-flavin reductase
MKLALFGASGTVGQRILREALRRGHSVTALVRDPSRISEQGPNLRATAGNILDPEPWPPRSPGMMLL